VSLVQGLASFQIETLSKVHPNCQCHPAKAELEKSLPMMIDCALQRNLSEWPDQLDGVTPLGFDPTDLFVEAPPNKQ
jgi:hypothetical protein